MQALLVAYTIAPPYFLLTPSAIPDTEGILIAHKFMSAVTSGEYIRTMTKGKGRWHR